MNCTAKDMGIATHLIIINKSDLKKVDENGITMKRKYGKFKREIKKYALEWKKNNHA